MRFIKTSHGNGLLLAIDYIKGVVKVELDFSYVVELPISKVEL